MTDQCKPNTDCCRICPPTRYEVQYKDGDDWIIYGYTRANTGCPLKEELEAKGKEVRVIDTDEKPDPDKVWGETKPIGGKDEDTDSL